MIDGCYVVKFGESMRIFERDYEEHKKIFGEQTKVIFVAETDNNILVETQFKKFLKTKNALVEMEFGGKNRTELFKTSPNLSIKEAIEAAQMLIEQNPSNAEKKVKDYNKQELALNTKLEIAQQKTKQIQIKETEKTKQEEAKAIQMQEQTKQIQIQEGEKTKQIQEQEKTKQDQEKTKQMQIELDMIKEKNKEQPIKNIKIKDMYFDFLEECTEENKEGHIHCTTLYESYKEWFKINNPNIKIPGNKIFVAAIKKHKDIVKVKVDNQSQLGIKNLKIKD
jgi:hypothetical protein